ncbi:MAG: hypothetical protein LAP13_21735 [Acidobacteriia bacterium]|nr:hypothetical protein [Terriglobia bacterium]
MKHEEAMLRGALSRGFNTGLAIVLLTLPSVGMCLGYTVDARYGTEQLLKVLLAYVLGVLAGSPAYFLNRKALTELYDALRGKFALSSQLALLRSWHGLGAVAYFYVVEYLAIRSFPVLAKFGPLEGVGGFILQGVYLSANVLPFVLPPRRSK